jgi:predicted ATP-grasp superfamily ATP-dependent carboligase
MKINIFKDASIKKGVTIIEGFPGFGLVGPIATEFLTEHLKTTVVGEFVYHDLPATTAIHNGEVVLPMGLHYSEKFNLLIFHTILSVKGKEWIAAEEVMRIADEFKAKEIISIEGVNAMVPGTETKLFSFGNKRFEELGALAMQESIIMGVTAALLLRTKNTSCLFAETHSGLPDSKAAAAIIGLLNEYLQLGVDIAPLTKQAQEFELKLKTILQQTQQTVDAAEKKELSYLG